MTHDPSFVSHKVIDAQEILARVTSAWVVVWEMVEEFRGEFAHGGRLDDIGTSHSLQ
jgi:hypothetical protein